VDGGKEISVSVMTALGISRNEAERIHSVAELTVNASERFDGDASADSLKCQKMLEESANELLSMHTPTEPMGASPRLRPGHEGPCVTDSLRQMLNDFNMPMYEDVLSRNGLRSTSSLRWSSFDDLPSQVPYVFRRRLATHFGWDMMPPDVWMRKSQSDSMPLFSMRRDVPVGEGHAQSITSHSVSALSIRRTDAVPNEQRLTPILGRLGIEGYSEELRREGVRTAMDLASITEDDDLPESIPHDVRKKIALYGRSSRILRLDHSTLGQSLTQQTRFGRT